VSDPLPALRASVREQLAARGRDDPSPALLDLRVQQIGDSFVLRPKDWEQLRHEEGGAGRPVPYWASPWPSGRVLAEVLTVAPGARVLEIGCGLALPSLAAARAGAAVLATDGSLEAVTFAAHSFALNELVGEVAVVDWAAHGDALISRGPWDLVLAADVLYVRANVELALRLLPRLGAEVLLADPGRAGARDFLAAARATFTLSTTHHDEVRVHRLTPKWPGGARGTS
jgi:predicted nicotinamide N-methyase